MSKVYIVVKEEPAEQNIIGVFESEKDAEYFIRGTVDRIIHCWEIGGQEIGCPYIKQS